MTMLSNYYTFVLFTLSIDSEKLVKVPLQAGDK